MSALIAAEIHGTSYGRAVEQALAMAEAGLTPRQVIASVNINWSDREPNWDDAIYVLAYAWRRHCSFLPQTAFETIPGGGAKKCVGCGDDLADNGAAGLYCPRCRATNPTAAKTAKAGAR